MVKTLIDPLNQFLQMQINKFSICLVLVGALLSLATAAEQANSLENQVKCQSGNHSLNVPKT